MSLVAAGALANPSTEAATSAEITAAVTSVSASIGSQVAGGIASVVSVRAGAPSPAPSASAGASGQGAADPIGVWADASFTQFKDDTFSSEMDGSGFIGTIGADYRTGDLLVGGALSLEAVDADLKPVIGGTKSTGEFEQVGVSISPYVAFNVTDEISVSGAAGLSFAESRLETVTNGAATSGDTNVFRYFLSGSVNGNTVIDDSFTVGGGVSLLWLENTSDSYTNSAGTFVDEQTTELGRVTTSARGGYLIPVKSGFLEPYATVKYEYDFAATDTPTVAGQVAPANDNSAFRLGGGLAFYSGLYGTGSIEGERMFGREDEGESRVSLTYRLSF